MTPRFALAEIADVPHDIREVILAVQERSGFVPHVFLMLARRPAEFRAFFAYHDALMGREGSSLTKGDREMIITSISAANRCTYCVVAHGALLRIFERKALVADQVAVNYLTADITPRQRAVLDFAHQVNAVSHTVDDASFMTLREHGIEIGGGLGPKAPPIWRVGLMGVNANRETADRVISAFDAVLPR